MGMMISHDMLLGRWRLSLELFGRVFMEDVGAEPGSVSLASEFAINHFCMLGSSCDTKMVQYAFDPFKWRWSCSHPCQILTELGGFEVKESKFRREMEKLRNLQSRDLALEVDRDRDQLIQQTMRQLNAHFGRRCTTTPMAVHRVKVTFKDEPGEGSGVARSFYTAIALALLSNDKLPNLDCVQSVSKGMQASSTCHHDYNSSMTTHRNYCTLWNVIVLLCFGVALVLKTVAAVFENMSLVKEQLQMNLLRLTRSTRPHATPEEPRQGEGEEKWRASSGISEGPRQVSTAPVVSEGKTLMLIQTS